MGNLIDLTGQRFGRWTVLRLDHNNAPRGEARWICRCDCSTLRSVSGHDLRSGKSNSCGCLKRELASSRMKLNPNYGESQTRLYTVWTNMKSRVRNPNDPAYSDYGGRGIQICEEWMDFQKFKRWAIESGYNDSLTIDRVDVNGDYCPENCRWTTRTVQNNNTRRNHTLTVNGRTMTVAEWAKETGVSRLTLHQRIKNGWSDEDVILKPIRKSPKSKN